jgi:hypothetical protein
MFVSKKAILLTVTAALVPTSVLSQTITCEDTTLRLKIPVTDVEKPYLARTCTWVGARDTVARCALTGVKAACPLTCGACDESICEDPDPTFRFRFEYLGKTITRNCEFIGNVPRKIVGRCNASNNICRKTCNQCS